MPARRADDDDLYLALAAVVLSRANLGDDAAGAPADGADELALLRRRRFEEHALARARHPSARARRSA